MRHARQDYQRIQDPAAIDGLRAALDHAMDVVAHGTASGKFDEHDVLRALSRLTKVMHPTLVALLHPLGGSPIADDEPVFLLRAMDRTAPQAVRAWAQLQYEQKGNREMGRLALDHAVEMETWGREHGAKVADLPGGD